ncbi:hypothetical protein NCPPB3778_10 [Rathayibacter phage NCPPB3778]|nr:hypothetical protein NCPPB3778_10 [Rathayibacter phage NCPPB3778]
MANNFELKFNDSFFDEVLKSPGVKAMVDDAAGKILAAAKQSAPVDTGAYRDSLHIEHHESKYRQVARVVADDPKTMIIESRTGNLARAIGRSTK